MAYFVEADCIADAWLKAVCKVWFNGHMRPTEHQNFALTLDQPLVIHVNRPQMQPSTCDDVSDFKAKAIEKYKEDFLKVQKTGHDYTYPNRLFDYPTIDGDGFYVGDGDGYGINQIDYMIEQMSKTWYTRRQIAHTWHPSFDMAMESCPCLQDVQFVVNDHTLNLVAHFRSNDILDAWLANANGLFTIQNTAGKRMFDATKVVHGNGYLETYSTFPHIYENRLMSAAKVVEYALKKFNYSESERLYVD